LPTTLIDRPARLRRFHLFLEGALQDEVMVAQDHQLRMQLLELVEEYVHAVSPFILNF
jgi:hypothetical protein